MAQQKRKAHSNYARHNKSPYRYSDTYQRWHDASVKAGSNLADEALEHDAAFRRREALPDRQPDDPALYAEDFADAEARR